MNYNKNTSSSVTPSNITDNPIDSSDNRKKILIEANIIIDIFLERPSQYFKDLEEIFNLILEKKIQAYVTEIGIKSIWLVLESFHNKGMADRTIDKIRNLFVVCPLENVTLNTVYDYSEKSESLDLDSSLLLTFAHAEKIDAIITSNITDFVQWVNCYDTKDIPLLTPSYFKKWYQVNDIYEFEDKIETIRKKLETSITKTIDFKDEEYCVGDWYVVGFEIVSAKDCPVTQGTITVKNKETGEPIQKFSYGKGAVDTFYRALKSSIKSSLDISKYELFFVKIKNLASGYDAQVKAYIILRCGQKLFKGENVHTDSIKALINACIQAVDNIYKGIEFSLQNFEQSNPKIELRSEIVQKLYEEGEKNFSGAKLRGINLSEADFSNADFSNADLEGANLSGATLKGANLSGAKLEKANLSGANLSVAQLEKANLQGANLSYALLAGTNFNKATLDEAILNYAILTCANLSNATLNNIDIRTAFRENAIFKNINLLPVSQGENNAIKNTEWSDVKSKNSPRCLASRDTTEEALTIYKNLPIFLGSEKLILSVSPILKDDNPEKICMETTYTLSLENCKDLPKGIELSLLNEERNSVLFNTGEPMKEVSEGSKISIELIVDHSKETILVKTVFENTVHWETFECN
jgi:uncharacterized protein YjbI with pentapeptide repeats